MIAFAAGPLRLLCFLERVIRPIWQGGPGARTARFGRVSRVRLALMAVLNLLALPLLAADPGPATAVARQLIPHQLVLEAAVEAVRQTTVAARLTGQVLDVAVDAGAQVRKGQVLLRIDAREAGEVLAAARAQLALAQAQYARSTRLLQQQFISPAAHDKARNELDTAQAVVTQASVGLAHAVIRAPFSGVVTVRHAEPGDMALPGQPLLTLIDPGQLRVTASVPQAQLSLVRAAQAVHIEFPESGLPPVPARSQQVMPSSDPATHTTAVRLGLPGDLPGVQAGQFARAVFTAAARARLVVAPQSLVRRGEVVAVYVLEAGGGIVMRQVRVGERLAENAVEVLAGLKEGERVLNDPLRAVQALRAKQGHSGKDGQ